MLPVFLILVSLLSSRLEARATWYSKNIENGADIIRMDLRWPWWSPASYFVNWNSGFCGLPFACHISLPCWRKPIASWTGLPFAARRAGIANFFTRLIRWLAVS